ncbi:unnamed protein product [Tilletia laevis]|uniref:SAM-dependent MTase RsmB/NOP-type domain-containing protein n=2 Tax=Tilletia TaxID=13289 RepID=A0A177VGE1_9BASI|nr:hypothetical protein CF336_g642 [Tilletia laevis]KAE8265126.1 hypothetical protein A4X03_0g466 [Tilletia caries]CAD6974085.1 unnamed protein product [Tilletia controversa]KAE8208311.1 hypothetical protein CF335_g505 [Tilletia laevis]CAD6886102.1 unnamed protein product [Tilletia caries]
MDFYLRTAQVLDRASLAQSSLKSHVAALSQTQGDAKRLLALSVSCLSYKPTLDGLVAFAKKDLLSSPRDWKVFESAVARSALARTEDTKAAKGKAGSLLLVLLHDLLLSPKKAIQASAAWPPHALLLKYKTRLRAELTRVQIRAGKSRVEELRLGGQDRERAERIPRWARVNEGKTSVAAVIVRLEQEGWKQVEGPQLSKGRNFMLSPHIPSLLAFHPSSTSALLSHELYSSGQLILQDLASCFPAQILASDYQRRGRSLEAIDATAAPGNKTSHLSALLGSTASVTAFEMSPQRYQTLTSQLTKAGCLTTSTNKQEAASSTANKKRKRADLPVSATGTLNVTALRADFLETEPADARWHNVELMLLDPSCSGTGIVNRLDYLSGAGPSTEEQEEDDTVPPTSTKSDPQSKPSTAAASSSSSSSSSALTARLTALSAFQLTMVKHAMRFPHLQRIVYSTCSIHAEEDEHVVVAALESAEAQEGGWRLMGREKVLPAWPVRGRVEDCKGDTVIAESVIRCVPGGELSRVRGVELGTVHIEASNGFFVAAFERTLAEDEKESPSTVSNQAAQQPEGPEAKKRKQKKKKNKKTVAKSVEEQ